MKVLHISPRYYPYNGGAERYCQEMSERLARDGHQIVVFTTNAWDLEFFWNPARKHISTGTAQHNGVEIWRFPVRHPLSSKYSYAAIRYVMQRLSSLPWHTQSLLFRLCQWLPWVPDLPRALAQETRDFDLVHVVSISFDSLAYAAYRFAKWRGIQLVITPFVHLGEPQDDTVRRYYTMPHQLAMIRDSDAIIVQTQLEQDFLLARGVSVERVHIVGPGINPQELIGGNSARFRAKYHLDGPLVFSIGAQAYDKGSVQLVEAMTKLWNQGCPASLVLAGPVISEFRHFYDAQPQWVRERCRLLGYISEKEKRDLLAAGDVFAMPSRTDSFGIVYLEAWLYKKPVVGALAGGVPDVISDNEDGYLVPFGDAERLAEVLHRLLADPAQAQRLGARGYEKAVTQHSWSRKYAAIQAIYEHLTSRSQSAK